MAHDKGSPTPGTPDLRETELRDMKVDDLRQEARDAGVGATSGMKKVELVREVAKASGGGGNQAQGAEERQGVPATVEGTEHGDHLGVLRIDLGGDDSNLRHVSWEEWFDTFDARGLNFIYQEQRGDGRQSSFFRLENPEREDA